LPGQLLARALDFSQGRLTDDIAMFAVSPVGPASAE
jgi:hypothetical protein